MERIYIMFLELHYFLMIKEIGQIIPGNDISAFFENTNPQFISIKKI